jgi:hypothetical protein
VPDIIFDGIVNLNAQATGRVTGGQLSGFADLRYIRWMGATLIAAGEQKI